MMRLKTLGAAAGIMLLLTAASCGTEEKVATAPSTGVASSAAASSQTPVSVPSQSPQPAPSQIERPLPSPNYDPRHCGVTSWVGKGQKSNVLLTIDDFPYQDGEIMVRVAEWAQKTGTMMQAFPVAKEVATYDRAHGTNLVQRTRDLGTYVSNHTYAHQDLLTLSRKNRGARLVTSEVAAGIDSSYVRPPYGAYDKRVKLLIERKERARVCHWTIDTLDWQKDRQGKYPAAATLVKRVEQQLKGIKPGEPVVILGHYQTNYPKALQGIRDVALKAGLQMCPIPRAATTSNVPFPVC